MSAPDLLALGDELPLQLTPDGREALPCPIHGCLMPLSANGRVRAECPSGCASDDVLAVYAEQSPMLAGWLAKDAKAPSAGRANGASIGDEGMRDQLQSNGAGAGRQRLDRNPQVPLRDTALEPAFQRIPPQNIEMEQALLGAVLIDNRVMADVARAVVASAFYREEHREIFKAMCRLQARGLEIDALTLCEDLKTRGLLEAVGGAHYIAVVADCVPTAHHVAGYAEIVVEKALRRDRITPAQNYLAGLYNGVSASELNALAESLKLPLNGDGGPVMLMNQQESVELNRQYLSRPEIIERLGYGESIMLVIGGKHHGKTTNIRTLALSVCRGLPIWGRKTTKGPVLYMASDDELASTRNELLEMGWAANDALILGRIAPDSVVDLDRTLQEIGDAAIKMGAVMIVLDMLFDFTDIKDELSYAATRGAIGKIQALALRTGCLVVCSHHTPKYLTDVHNASNAALGSQGIAARFSPIVLTRKWADNLYTVESTTTRDPRGEAIVPTKIARNAKGWIEAIGEFKESMKWEIYAKRVLDLFEDFGRGLSVQSVAEKLGIDRARAQITLKELADRGKLSREKMGHRYLYFLVKL